MNDLHYQRLMVWVPGVPRSHLLWADRVSREGPRPRSSFQLDHP